MKRTSNQSLLSSAATAILADGTLSALLSDVTIAVPVLQERISPVLDAATRLLLVKRRRGKEVARKEILLGPLAADALARSVAELCVDVLLCAALSEPLLRSLEAQGVRVFPHLCGPVDAVMRAFCCRQLDRDEFRMPGCWGLHSKNDQCRRARSLEQANTLTGKSSQRPVSA